MSQVQLYLFKKKTNALTCEGQSNTQVETGASTRGGGDSAHGSQATGVLTSVGPAGSRGLEKSTEVSGGGRHFKLAQERKHKGKPHGQWACWKPLNGKNIPLAQLWPEGLAPSGDASSPDRAVLRAQGERQVRARFSG